MRPDRVEILGVRTAGSAAARFFLLPTIAVVFREKKISDEDGENGAAARGCGETRLRHEMIAAQESTRGMII